MPDMTIDGVEDFVLGNHLVSHLLWHEERLIISLDLHRVELHGRVGQLSEELRPTLGVSP